MSRNQVKEKFLGLVENTLPEEEAKLLNEEIQADAKLKELFTLYKDVIEFEQRLSSENCEPSPLFKQRILQSIERENSNPSKDLREKTLQYFQVLMRSHVTLGVAFTACLALSLTFLTKSKEMSQTLKVEKAAPAAISKAPAEEAKLESDIQSPHEASTSPKTEPHSSVALNIPDGFKAITIPIEARSSVEGWSRPGATVDVVWSTVIQGRQAVNTIVQNAKVLASDDTNKKTNPLARSTTTLLVRKDDANKIQLASISGALSLALRGDRPDQPLNNRPITIDSLLSESEATEEVVNTGPTVRMKDASGNYVEYTLKNGKLVLRESKKPKKEKEKRK